MKARVMIILVFIFLGGFGGAKIKMLEIIGILKIVSFEVLNRLVAFQG